MDLRRRSPPSTTTTTTTITQPNKKKKKDDLLDSSLPFLLLLYLINGVFFTFFFFSVVYYLLLRWPENIRHSTHLHLVTFSEMAAIVSVISSFIYLLGFIHPFFSPNFRVSFEEEEIKPISDKIHMKNTINFPEEEEIKPISDKVHIENTINYPEEEDEEVIQSVIDGKTPSYSLESKLHNCKRAASIRRKALERTTGISLEKLPLDGFDYDSILGQCCEMPVGYVQIPVGVAGPLLLDGMEFTIPMATTEGCLVASTNRGCKAISACGGATSILLKDAMTRSPVVRFATAKRASELKFFLEELQNFDILASEFNKSSRFGRLQRIVCAIAGRNLYIRFSCSTGDAMGMNMVSKGVQNVLDYLRKDFPDMEVIGISGNYCSDKKPAAVNWIEGRGKSVVCEAIIKEEVVKNVLKTDVVSLVELNTLKNLTGSAMAGVLGGYNAHASNIVTAVYIATGQDPF